MTHEYRAIAPGHVLGVFADDDPMWADWQPTAEDIDVVGPRVASQLRGPLGIAKMTLLDWRAENPGARAAEGHVERRPVGSWERVPVMVLKNA